MSAKQRIEADATTAMREKDSQKLSTLRLMKAAIKNAEVAKIGELTEEEVLTILTREVKQRREAILDFSRGGRADLVEKAEGEIKVINAYLPAALSSEELEGLIREAIAATGAAKPQDQGKVMGYLSPKIKGKADGKEVSVRVRQALENHAGI